MYRTNYVACSHWNQALKLGDRTSLRCVLQRTKASNAAEKDCRQRIRAAQVHLVLDIPLGRGTLGSRLLTKTEVSASAQVAKMGQGVGKPTDIAALSALSVVRIRKKLPPDEVNTVGGGCIVKWVLGGSESSLKQSTNSSVFLLTTTQVITKNDLIASDGSISVELFNGDRIASFNLGVKSATDLLEPLPGRLLRGTGEALKEVSFIMIPIEKFDDRSWFLSKFQGNIFEKRSLTCSPPSNEALQSYISKREVFCCVTCDDRTKNNRRFDTEIYCLEFDEVLNSEEFVLTSRSSQECTEERRLKQDFYRGENPKGGLLIGIDGNIFGMLAISTASNKIFPLFLPTLDPDNNGTTVGESCISIFFFTPLMWNTNFDGAFT